MHYSLEVVAHHQLTDADLSGLRQLFDSEYLEQYGEWEPDQPYGYAAHDVHVIARDGWRVVGHVGWARRDISVGMETVTIAGVGGVLVSDATRGRGLGRELMGRAVQSIVDQGGVSFGYVGCREEAVFFYLSCGWKRIVAREKSIGRDGEPITEDPGQPILIRSIVMPLGQWPEGDIDLRGRAW